MPWLVWACAFSVAAETAIWTPAGKFIMAGSPSALTGPGIAASTAEATGGVGAGPGTITVAPLPGGATILVFTGALAAGSPFWASPVARAQESESAAINRILMSGRCPRTARFTK